MDSKGRIVWPLKDDKPKGEQVTSKQAAYIITDIMAGNTVMKTNPFWGKWAIKDHGRRRPAAYKTGTTSDNRDVAAYGYLAPPKDKNAPALAVGVWMGNSDNSPNDGKLSLDTSAPLWSAILSDISEGLPMANFKSPGGLKKVTVDAFTGTKPGPFTHKTVEEMFIPGHLPPKSTASRVSLQVDAASGLVWREGASDRRCRGATSTSPRWIELPWQRATATGPLGAARDPACGARRGHPDGLLTAASSARSGRRGAPVRPLEEVPDRPPRSRSATRVAGLPVSCRPTTGPSHRSRRSPDARLQLDDHPAPPSPLTGPHRAHERMVGGLWRTASRRAPVPGRVVMIALSRPASAASSR
jgi:membrane carboxypeptidase/penicillin-binding protein PbpC